MSPIESRVTLGRTGLQVCPLGVAGGYGVDEGSLLAAFERGVNYWYHGSVRGRGMTRAIRTLVQRGKRNELVVVLQSYSRFGWLLERTFRAGLRSLGLEYADVLLLGLFNDAPPRAVVERALSLKERGLVRHLAISAHNRGAFVAHANTGHYDLLHVRYSAAHPGAEADVFERLPEEHRPGIATYTATRWGQLLDPRRMPVGEAPLRGRDCYRFVLTNPAVNVCLCGPRNAGELREALAALDEGTLTAEEERRVRAIGQHVRSQRSAYQRWRAGREMLLSGKA